MKKNSLAGINALLFAAGNGTRLRPLTYHIPKCLVRVGGTPLLQYWLENLFSAGIDRVMINTHYLSGLVESFCKQSPYSSRIDLVHEPELLGTAGTLRKNRSYFGQTMFMAHADNYSLFSSKLFLQKHLDRSPTCMATMMTFTTDSPSSCGIVQTDDNGTLIGYYEKELDPPGNLANAAVFLLEKEAFNWLDLAPNATDFCKEIVPLGLGHFQTFFNGNYHRDIGTIESLNRANLDFYKLIGSHQIP